MRAFLSIKFWGDDRNRQDVEEVIAAIEGAGVEVYCFRRDAEKWGEIEFEPGEMMNVTFNEISRSDFLIADVADWPIGVGVEAGYAYAKGIPVICICSVDKKVANTVAGLAAHVVGYQDYSDMSKQLTTLFTQRSPSRNALFISLDRESYKTES
jgi:nucleoside 2-deoxyribosyltransferase